MSTDRDLLVKLAGMLRQRPGGWASDIGDMIDAHLKEPAQDERKALAEDAARYRLLRDTANWDVLPVDEGADRAEWRCLFHSPYGMRHEADDDLDCALDALAAEQEAQASGRARSPVGAKP